jgi:endothelin-converting enzyme/putative endopeptidase
MKSNIFLLLVLTLATVALAQQPNAGAPAAKVDAVLPYTPSLDVNSMDRTVDPCVDFYQYSCGGWQKNNPIPPDQTSWDVYSKLYEENLGYLRSILEQAAAAKQRDAVTQKVGDYYTACMDETAVDRRGFQPLKNDLQAISGIKSVHDLAPVVARLQMEFTWGNPIIFGGGSGQDPDDSEQVIAVIEAGGLGLPDRDYYTKEDEKSKETRARYVQHVQKMFALLGESPAAAQQDAETVMRIETGLAKASLTRVERRDPYKLKNKMGLPQLKTLAPNFDWTTYFATLQPPTFKVLNVTEPTFLKEVNTQLASTTLKDWQAYLRYHVANSWSPYLSAPFVDENFEFYRKYLRGAAEIQPRWKRCVQFVDFQLGEALGQEYVRKTFSPELKASTLKMTLLIEDEMAKRIQALDWMSPETKQQALGKLKAVRNKIGYPDKWRDYSSVTITPDDFFNNARNAIRFENRRQLNKIGKPVDRNEWDITPPTVNAYYNPQMNDINFPAGVLQPPLYDAKIDDAPNYGNTGSTIGHELTHGFDDEGRLFDAKGNLKDWWTKQDAGEFVKRTACVQDQYAQYVAVDDIHINSKLTTGEDVADLGGTILAYMAWKDATKDIKLESRDNLTPEQRFFVGFAQWACENRRPEEARVRAMTDPHSPAKYRINGIVVNMPEFANAFSCKQDQPMVNPADKICKIW